MFLINLVIILGLQNLLVRDSKAFEEKSYIVLEASLDKVDFEHLKWIELDYFEHMERKDIVMKYYASSVNSYDCGKNVAKK